MQSAAYQISYTKERPVYSQILLHVSLAVLIYVLPVAAAGYGAFYFLYSILTVIQTGNKNNEAAFFAVYMACYEVVIRMSHDVIIYEFGKYSFAAILLVGIIVERKPRKLPVLAILYFALLKKLDLRKWQYYIKSTIIIPIHKFNFKDIIL